MSAALPLVLLLLGGAKAEEPPLAPLARWEVRGPADARFDPSGLAVHRGSFVVVSDRPSFGDLYVLSPEDEGAFRAVPFLRVRSDAAASDLEGLARCGERWLVAAEDAGGLLVVEDDGRASLVRLDLDAPHLAAGGPVPPRLHNAGLESVACAPDGRVWTAQERQPRFLYEVALASAAVPASERQGQGSAGVAVATGFYDVDPGWDGPRLVRGKEVSPDFADLQFEGGRLYALQRNDQSVLRIDPARRTLERRLRLALDEAALYEYEDPYGMAEGLFLSEDRIYVLLDNNGASLKGRSGDVSGLLFEFPRPPGF